MPRAFTMCLSTSLSFKPALTLTTVKPISVINSGALIMALAAEDNVALTVETATTPAHKEIQLSEQNKIKLFMTTAVAADEVIVLDVTYVNDFVRI